MDRAVLFIITASIGFGVGASLQKQGLASTFPNLTFRTLLGRPGEVVRGILASRTWLPGILINFLGTFFYFQALSEGELTIVQPLVSLNIVVAVLAGVLVLRETLHRREWAGIGAMILGTVLLASAAAGDVEAVKADMPAATKVRSAGVDDATAQDIKTAAAQAS